MRRALDNGSSIFHKPPTYPGTTTNHTFSDPNEILSVKPSEELLPSHRHSALANSSHLLRDSVNSSVFRVVSSGSTPQNLSSKAAKNVLGSDQKCHVLSIQAVSKAARQRRR
jgi:hypothetical protein